MKQWKKRKWRTAPREKETDREANRLIKQKETPAGQYEEPDFSRTAEKVRRDGSDANIHGGITLKRSGTEPAL